MPEGNFSIRHAPSGRDNATVRLRLALGTTLLSKVAYICLQRSAYVRPRVTPSFRMILSPMTVRTQHLLPALIQILPLAG